MKGMTLTSNGKAAIIRTDSGLAIAGTRITLYQLMDYIHANHSPQVIRQDFPQITDEQFDAAMSYIETNWAEVEAEYQIVVKEDEENRQYWEARNREHFAQITARSPEPGCEALYAKLADWKADIEARE
jgi:uncharacterized protein (DUF433 family)